MSRMKQLAAELARVQERAYALEERSYSAEEKLRQAEGFISEHGLSLKWEASKQWPFPKAE